LLLVCVFLSRFSISLWCSCRSHVFLVFGLSCQLGCLDWKRSSYHSNERLFLWVGTAARSWFPLSYLMAGGLSERERERWDEWSVWCWLEIGLWLAWPRSCTVPLLAALWIEGSSASWSPQDLVLAFIFCVPLMAGLCHLLSLFTARFTF
jgi:hypothetical protein